MSCSTFWKTIFCAAAAPAFAGTLITSYPKPAFALSTTTAPTHGATQTIEAVEAPALAAPAELISRYATYTFRLTNGQSQSMYSFYASPSNVGIWEEDLLGSSTLSPSGSTQVFIDDNRASCYYDFRAIFLDGSSTTHYGVDICDLASYTF